MQIAALRVDERECKQQQKAYNSRQKYQKTERTSRKVTVIVKLNIGHPGELHPLTAVRDGLLFELVPIELHVNFNPSYMIELITTIITLWGHPMPLELHSLACVCETTVFITSFCGNNARPPGDCDA